MGCVRHEDSFRGFSKAEPMTVVVCGWRSTVSPAGVADSAFLQVGVHKQGCVSGRLAWVWGGQRLCRCCVSRVVACSR